MSSGPIQIAIIAAVIVAIAAIVAAVVLASRRGNGSGPSARKDKFPSGSVGRYEIKNLRHPTKGARMR